MYDVVIIGAGPAGLSAGLILGRCRRRVLICDSGHPRNTVSGGVNGFLSRDGIRPAEFRRIGREQLGAYASVEIRDIGVSDVEHAEGRFVAALADGTRATSRKLLIATGVVDELPEIQGLRELYGTSVFHCPYCDGWELRDQPLAIYGRGEQGLGLALELTAWSGDLILCTDGPAELPPADLERLSRNGIGVREDRIAALEGTEGVLAQIRFVTGDTLARRGLFFSTGHHQSAAFARKLGCAFTAKGAVDTGLYEATNIPGVFVAGDASRFVQLTIVAAAEGAEAAFAINTQLLNEDLQ